VLSLYVLYAIGYVKGKTVARDTVVLNHLPQSPHFKDLSLKARNLTKPAEGFNYIYAHLIVVAPLTKNENGNFWSDDS